MSLFSKISIITLLILSNNISLFGQTGSHLDTLLTTKLDFVVKEYEEILEQMGDPTNDKSDRLAAKAKFVKLFINNSCPVYNDLNTTEFDLELPPREYGAIFLDTKTINSVTGKIEDIKYDSIIYSNATYFISLAIKKTTNIVYYDKPEYNSSPYWLKFTFTFNSIKYEREKVFMGLKLLSISSLENIDIIDNDNDQIINTFDKCPDIPGNICTYGCPDTDNDCLSDAEELRRIYGNAFYDECPELAGSKENNGCSDLDGDGIYDNIDICPKEYGKKYLYGCPDFDNDSLSESKEFGLIYPDLFDKCPKKYGFKCTFGCPDEDGDCIGDDEDDCPDVKGSKFFNGCPDRDNDRIGDNADKCPCDADNGNDYQGCPYPVYLKPQIRLNNRIGYGGSLTLFGLALQQELKSRSVYEQHENAKIARIGDPLFEEATQNRRNAIVLAGGGVVLTGLTYLRHSIKKNQDKNDYSNNCPYYTSSIELKITPISIGLIYTF